MDPQSPTALLLPEGSDDLAAFFLKGEEGAARGGSVNNEEDVLAGLFATDSGRLSTESLHDREDKLMDFLHSGETERGDVGRRGNSEPI